MSIASACAKLTYSIGQMQIWNILDGICWYLPVTNLLLAGKIFEYVKDLFYGVPPRGSQNLLAPAVKFVTFMAQRPPANIALLGGRVKVYDNFIKFPQVLTAAGMWRCCWIENWFKSVEEQALGSILWSLLVSTLYMSFLGSKDDRVLCVFEICSRVQTDLRRSFMDLSWVQRVRNIWRWRSVMKIIEIGRDWLLKHVLSKLLATTFKFVTSRAWRPQCTIRDICILWHHRLFRFHSEVASFVGRFRETHNKGFPVLTLNLNLIGRFGMLRINRKS